MACTCLTCGLMAAIHRHAEAVNAADPKPRGPTIDAVGAITAMADLIGSLIADHPDATAGGALLKMAHEALDAAVVAHRTGEVQVVTLGATRPRAVH